MSTEKLNFKIGLSGTYWDRKPKFEILVNGDIKVDSEISVTPEEIEYFTFNAEVEEDKTHSLQIRFKGKEWTDVKKTADGNGIESDQLLNVKEIRIDDIELEMLKWTHSTYTPDEPVDGMKPNWHVNLGLNGVYEIKFDSPFYVWLLSNM